MSEIACGRQPDGSCNAAPTGHCAAACPYGINDDAGCRDLTGGVLPDGSCPRCAAAMGEACRERRARGAYDDRQFWESAR